jgi:hypothetical protein
MILHSVESKVNKNIAPYIRVFTQSDVLPEYACARVIARLASGTYLIRLQERVYEGNLRKRIYVGFVAVMLSGCAAAVATDVEVASMENTETSFATCSYLRTQQASCDDLTKAYNEGFRAGKEIIAAEFRTKSELNQPYVWKPPMISEVDMPARVVNGVMIPAHRELVIVRPGYWVRADKVLKDQ